MSYLATAKKAEQKLNQCSRVVDLMDSQEVAPLRARVVDRVHGDNGNLRAVLVCSDLLEDHLWLIIDRSFTPTDDCAIYYPEELPLLKDKTLADLRQIHEAKLAFPGCRVIQEGPQQ